MLKMPEVYSKKKNRFIRIVDDFTQNQAEEILFVMIDMEKECLVKWILGISGRTKILKNFKVTIWDSGNGYFIKKDKSDQGIY